MPMGRQLDRQVASMCGRVALRSGVSCRLGQACVNRVPIASDGVKVWIDQDLCTGDGLCVDHCPDVFTLLDDGIAYVVESGVVMNDPGGSGSLASVTPRNERDVIEAADVCPGECIFIEFEEQLGQQG